MYESVFPKLVLVNDAAHDVPLLEDQLPLSTVLPSPIFSRDLDLAVEAQGGQPVREEADDCRDDLRRGMCTARAFYVQLGGEASKTDRGYVFHSTICNAIPCSRVSCEPGGGNHPPDLLPSPHGPRLDQSRSLHDDLVLCGVRPGPPADGPGGAGDVDQLHVLRAREESVARGDQGRAAHVVLDQAPAQSGGWDQPW